MHYYEALENEAEELAFYDHDSNRAVAVVWPAIVENRLTDALRACMRKDERSANELFRPDGALGTFGQKVRLAYMLGLYERDLKDDLIFLTKIRNAFAHRVDIVSFETSPVRDYMDQMHVLKVHRQLLDRLKKETKPDDDFNKKVTVSILSSELCDYRNAFHLCIRYMIHKLVSIERSLKQTIAQAPGRSS